MNTSAHLQVLVLEFLFGGELLVELVFEQPGEVNNGAALRTLVMEIEGLAVDGQHPDGPPLDHSVEITGPRLLLLREIDREGPVGRFLRSRLLGRRGGLRRSGAAEAACRCRLAAQTSCRIRRVVMSANAMLKPNAKEMCLVFIAVPP